MLSPLPRRRHQKYFKEFEKIFIVYEVEGVKNLLKRIPGGQVSFKLCFHGYLGSSTGINIENARSVPCCLIQDPNP